ncbi:hypothetical protein PV08_04573 [Exophiala spinifera]|uniref:FAD dependent oxidoreductase domain-containing protein n=1 Tax=Exophiala spinifera TaxID=91928 RepID=A0A0D2C119_9EURO|nr:uncharacterized protein PV08_04573 [Exophiala spinifera]KIW17379.1 hypothetical protein PV08_04573 [Exophiala spinifera]
MEPANDSPTSQHSDILIVGSGVFGTSTAYHLSQSHASLRVTVLDRAPAPSPWAASSDINKIVRADYSVPFYMDLAYEAMQYWTDSPLMSRFFHQTGWVALDEKDSDLSTRIRKNFRESGRADASADITLDEVKTRWDGVLAGIDTTGYDKAYTNSSAGWADASSAVEAMMAGAVQAGVHYEVGEAVELVADVDRRRLSGVRTADGRFFTGDRILLATGAWTPWLMSPLEKALHIPEEDSIHRQIQAAGVCVAAFQLSEAEAEHYSCMPVLIYGSKGEVMPPTAATTTTTANDDDKAQGERFFFFKFTNSNTFLNTTLHPDTGQLISVPAPDQRAVPSALRSESIDVIRRRVPAILHNGRVPDDWRICWDAVSPDQNQLITRHPVSTLSNLFLATAGSFHSWKFLPNIGRYVVNVLDGKSNGPIKDEAWAWKRTWAGRGAHEKVLPKREFADISKP